MVGLRPPFADPLHSLRSIYHRGLTETSGHYYAALGIDAGRQSRDLTQEHLNRCGSGVLTVPLGSRRIRVYQDHRVVDVEKTATSRG